MTINANSDNFSQNNRPECGDAGPIVRSNGDVSLLLALTVKSIPNGLLGNPSARHIIMMHCHGPTLACSTVDCHNIYIGNVSFVRLSNTVPCDEQWRRMRHLLGDLSH